MSIHLEKEMLVRAAGIEPARLTAADFKSDASTNFAMPAAGQIIALERVPPSLAQPFTFPQSKKLSAKRYFVGLTSLPFRCRTYCLVMFGVVCPSCS